MSGEGEGQSKSAKRRAAQKRAAAAGEEGEAPAPAAPSAPVPKAKAKAAAAASAPAAGYPDAKPKAKASPKAEPKAEPKAKAKAEPKAEPKAKAKAEPKAKAEAKAKAEPKAAAKAEPAAPKAEPKASAKGKAKAVPKQAAKSKAELEDEAKEKLKEDVNDFSAFQQFDDGSGGGWEVAAAVSKKGQKRQERQEEEKKAVAEARKFGVVGNKHIPGMTAAAGQSIPGMGPPGAGGNQGASQSLAASPAQMAAVQAEAAAAAAAVAGGPKQPVASATVNVPEARVGIVIGPKGAKIKMIQEKTETRIDTSGDVFTITGPGEGVAQAEQAIMDLITKGYTHLAFEDFSENSVMVYPTSLPDLIGKKGAIVIAIKEALHVEVSFPDTKTVKPGRKCKVTLAGKTQNVDKAKEVINDIIMYGHHEITHPGEMHEEVEVDEWCYSAIIGKKGCELRHIQATFKVKVNIPRDTSENTNVVIVGEESGVKRAKTYIEKTVYNFVNQVKGGRDGAEKATDDWGDEGPEEDWMKQYLYKR